MSFASEFKEFAMKGNVIDLAVGVVIGAAFGKIVNSLVGDVIMPPLAPLLGQHQLQRSGRADRAPMPKASRCCSSTASSCRPCSSS